MPVEYCVKHPAIRPTLGSFALNYLSPPAIIRFSALRPNVCYGSMLLKKSAAEPNAQQTNRGGLLFDSTLRELLVS